MLLALGLSLSLSAAPVPQRFCEAWKQQAPKARSYEEALIATAGAVKPTGAWEKAIERLFTSNPADHHAILVGTAKETGATFACPEFEFPQGKPSGTAVLTGDAAAAVAGLAADARGLYVLTCPGGGCELRALEGTTWRVLATGLGGPPSSIVQDHARIVVTADELFVVVEGGIVGVKRSGGAVRSLAKGLTRAHHLSLVGDRLWFADGEQIKWVARMGGPVTTAVAGGAVTMGSKEPVWFQPVEGGVAFVVWQGPLQRASGGKVAPVGTRDVFSPASLGGVLYAHEGQRLVSIDLGKGTRTPVTKAPIELGELALGDGELLAPALGADWRTPTSLVAWRPTAPEFQLLVKNAGMPGFFAANSRTVYWYEASQRAVLSAPRQP